MITSRALSRGGSVAFSIVLIAGVGVSCHGSPNSPSRTGATQYAPLAPIVSMQVVPAISSLTLGETVALTLDVRLGDGVPPSGPMPIWSSSNPTAITVDAKGRATAVGLGEAIIEATAHGRRADLSIAVIR